MTLDFNSLDAWQSNHGHVVHNVNRTARFLMTLFFCIYALGPQHLLFAQENGDQLVRGDDGILRWRNNNKEITGFGVNYTVPFAHAYRSGKKLGVDLKKAIDEDVYQFARLGFDLYRVHVWDCEISDTLGNLIDNEHLELFDYLLLKLKERNINAIITPIAYWGNGWPEPDEPTPGFSTKYGKEKCLNHPDAIKAQENYLAQFINHVNRFTGEAYKSDPSILAFEISNEPHHRGTPDEVSSFIRRMKEAIRSTGCSKPVLYNVTHSVHLAEAYYNSGIDGGTFQWYPTGLGFQKELGGNMLPNVDRYTIPFDDVMRKHGSARFVYEFDAADMASTYMYPAMARSFRTSGMQLATHFSYDPTFLAPYNTEYNTHFMNLVYAPRKALSLMICAEIFRNIPLYADFGVYPNNTSFGPFRISYEDDLAEMVTEKKFIYTHHTATMPPAPEKLELIAGWGNSPLVEYDGTGAYFLDRLGDGIWRLELMPDAVIVDNLFGRNSLEKVRAVIEHNRRKIKFNLPEFSEGLVIESVDWRDSIIYREVKNGSAELVPGIYLLMSPKYEQTERLSLISEKKIEWDTFIYYPSKSDPNYSGYSSARIKSASASKPSSSYLSLFDASSDYDWVNRQWRQGSRLITTDDGTAYMYVKLEGLVRSDEENLNAPPIGDYTMRHYFGDLIDDRKNEMMWKTYLVFNGHAVSGNFPVQVSLVMKDGSSFGSIIELNPDSKSYKINLNGLKKMKTVLMPRPYPTFLPYYSVAGKATQVDLTQIESLQISIGPGLSKEDWGKTFEFMVSGVYLE